MMVMGLYVYVEHIHPGHGRRWFNADAIALAKGAYWDATNGVIVTPQDEALSEAVTENWWETDDLANAPGDGEEEPPTRPDEGATREEPAITGDDEMLDHKFNDGKTVASYGNRLAPQIHVSTKDPASISAVTWDSDKSSLQQELAATQAKLKQMEEQIRLVMTKSALTTNMTN
jgi:outer membrane protein OmpA-like peptidoglycan-associated protein